MENRGIPKPKRAMKLAAYSFCNADIWGAFLCVMSIAIATAMQTNVVSADALPHVVLIMADDLGYGDVQPLNPKSVIPTPAFNRLAREGLTFTDAHTPSSVCTPTRYGLLTGRYCWRTRLKQGVLNGYGEPLMEADRETLGSLMRRAGYSTSVVGKWHLGLAIPGGQESMDLSRPLVHHPGTVGFDHSFIIPASLDFPPYVYFRDGLATTSETVPQDAVGFPAYTRSGPRAADFKMQECLDRLADEACSVIRQMKDSEKPIFLYFPMTAPHKPVLPATRYVGSTQLGPYGDFLRQVDDTVGRVIDELETGGILEQTLLIVTSDNGSFMYRMSDDETDHVDDAKIQGYRPEHHTANAIWRGTKADIWEAGHRVPFFVRLPGKVNAGRRVTRVIGLIDVMATLADWTGQALPKDAGPDSNSFASILKNPTDIQPRSPLICHSAAGMFAIRDGDWKLVAGNGSGGRETPKGTPFAEPWMLFNLEADPGEQNNVAVQNPDVLKRLKETLLKIKGDD